LLQKDYQFDAGFYGALNELSRKIAYFFHCSLQGYACYPEAAGALSHVAKKGMVQGLAADGQCFTLVQLRRALLAQDESVGLEELLTDAPIVLSCEVRARTPSERLQRQALDALLSLGIGPSETLYVTSRLPGLATAKRLAMRTALFAGDKASLQA